jgi:hypothetical protein
LKFIFPPKNPNETAMIRDTTAMHTAYAIEIA